jgi:hypothetical protein
MNLFNLNTLYSLSIILLTALSTVAHAAVPEEISAISGNYAGMAYNGSNLDPVVTVLVFDARGRFGGTYKVDDENGVYEGRLSNLIPEGNRAFSLEWTDQFGEGFVYLEFSADYSSFSGYWTDIDGEDQFPWNGRRQ